MAELDDTVTLSIRLPAATRDQFSWVMRERGTTVSEHLRQVILATLKGSVPGPRPLSPNDIAQSLLARGGEVGTGYFMSDEEAAQYVPLGKSEHAYRQTIIQLAKIIISQNRVLKHVRDAVQNLEEAELGTAFGS